MSRTPAVGVITNDEHAVFQQHIILGAREVAQAHGLDVLVDSIAEDSNAPPRPVSLDAGKIAGYLVIAAVLGEKDLAMLVASSKPVTLVSHHVASLPIPAVISNNAQGMTRLVRHLIADRERRKFVYVRGQPNQRDSIERERAFEDELMRWNLPDAYRLRGDFDPHTASASLEALLATGATFDALVAADFLMAVAALDVLRRAGLRVPDDVSVAGFGDGEAAQAAGLTTVAANVVDQGRRAARQLIGQIHGLRIRGLTVLSTELVLRATCCAGH